MKIINVTVKIAENEKTPIAEAPVAPQIHHCGECKHFYRHYIYDAYHGYQAINFGHCAPPKKYSRISNKKYLDCACMYFEQKN